jgi:hypothetical protein
MFNKNRREAKKENKLATARGKEKDHERSTMQLMDACAFFSTHAAEQSRLQLQVAATKQTTQYNRR